MEDFNLCPNASSELLSESCVSNTDKHNHHFHVQSENKEDAAAVLLS